MTRSISRRTVLGAIGSLAGAAIGLPGLRAEDAGPQLRLRLLATSDLHMFVLDWDYYRAKADASVGLARIASLIHAARAENPNTLLFDNGDLLQGNPLADYCAEQLRPSASSPHPIVTIMGSLGYDAVGLGNHEFNYGLEFLEATYAAAPYPVVCANVTRVGGGPLFAPSAVLERSFKDNAGTTHRLRIGVIGFVPPQIMIWDKARLSGQIEASDMVLAAKALVPELRARCDVLVALCHGGINANEWVDRQENAAYHLAAVPGIDAVITGHTHRVFPGPDHAGLPGVDAENGKLNGVPAVMPGFWGSHLGVIDLDLRQQDGRWGVAGSHVEARPIYKREQGRVEPLAARDAAVAAAINSAHQGTLAWIEQPVGALDTPVHSYFVWAGFDPATALVNAAQLWYARPLLAGSADAGLPLLSSAAPFRAGYTPDSFIDMARGPMPMRQVADLYIYSSNTVVVVKLSGAQIEEWLEFAARGFHTIDPAIETPQPLVEKRIASYNFDVFEGLTYAIDVSVPPRYDARGTLAADNRRIRDLRFAGEPLAREREFLVVTNNYRADGGGGVPALVGANIVLRAPDTNRDAIKQYFLARKSVSVPASSPWRFAPLGKPALAYFDTGLAALERLADAPAGVVPIAGAEPGYTRMVLKLS